MSSEDEEFSGFAWVQPVVRQETFYSNRLCHIVRNKYSAPSSYLLVGRRLMNHVFDLLVRSPYYVSELSPPSRTVPQVALPMSVRKSIQTSITLTVKC